MALCVVNSAPVRAYCFIVELDMNAKIMVVSSNFAKPQFLATLLRSAATSLSSPMIA